jgi:hypothetical protein
MRTKIQLPKPKMDGVFTLKEKIIIKQAAIPVISENKVSKQRKKR